jgi:hypothetical protein
MLEKGQTAGLRLLELGVLMSDLIVVCHRIIRTVIARFAQENVPR